MFSRSSGPSPKTAAQNPKRASNGPSIIGPDLVVAGDLKTDGDVQCDGVIDGDVESRTITVGEQARINGAITGEVVRVAGTVTGSIKARVVELTQTARITGDIIHSSLSIEAGAFVDGLCRHVDPKKETAEPPVSDSSLDEALPAEAGKPNLVVASKPATGDADAAKRFGRASTPT